MEVIKIAYFIDRIIEGGTELQLIEQINRLEGNGVRQILFCLHKSDDHDYMNIKCRTEIIYSQSLLSFNTFIKFIKAIRILRQEKIDIVQTYFFDSTVFGVLCGRFANVYKIISCRRDLGFWYTARLLFALMIVNAFTHRILVNSMAVKECVSMREYVNPAKIDVIKNGLDFSRYQFNESLRTRSRNQFYLNENDVCIGIIANMSRQVKRVDLFIEAAKKLMSHGINAKFFILGDGSLRQNHEKLAHTYNLDKHLLFLGKSYVKDELLAAMDIGIITSDSEGLSNSVLEYMASGIVPVVSNVGGNLELVHDKENGFFFKAGDAGDLARVLETVCRDKAMRMKIGSQAKAFVAQFDWNSKKVEMLQYYNELLGRG